MNLSAPFIRRPVGTTLLTFAIALAGALGYGLLPVAPLPQVESPTIQVQASLPGADPGTMASSVATPLERQFGRIAGITEMTSMSFLGQTTIVMQFDLNRNIDGAARDIQAAINAASSTLPTNLPGLPTWRKVNPADAPIMILALTSKLYNKGQMYDYASSVLQQKLSQIQGIGQVNVGGSALPAVRIDVNPTALNQLDLGLEDVRTAINQANANTPKGQFSDRATTWTLGTSDQLVKASEFKPLIVAYRNGAPVRISDVAQVTDDVEDLRTTGLADSKPAVLLIVYRQPGANIIETVDRVYEQMTLLQSEIPASIALTVALDRTGTIRASVRDVQITLCISVLLVIFVVFVFLRDLRTTLIPSVAVPVSLIGTFGVMYLMGYSIDNLSLMALTVATGFVVDDAIVVLENVTRHLELGETPFQAALKGAQEISSTVVTMSISLVSVFIPLLLMGGLVGRLFREFAVTLSIAVAISMVVSLTATPMLCAYLLHGKEHQRHGRLYRASEWVFESVLAKYRSSLAWVLHHPLLMLLTTIGTVMLTVYLYIQVPKGLFPPQDTGRLIGNILADQNASAQSMNTLIGTFAKSVAEDPAVQTVIAVSGGQGGGPANNGRFFVTLKDLNVRKLSVDQVMVRLRGKLATIPGATLFLQPVVDLRTGGRRSNALYQYTLWADDLAELSTWSTTMLNKMRTLPGLADVNTDQMNNGLQSDLTIDRQTASRLGISAQSIDATLYDAFGQRQVSTMYLPLNQYHVVMEVEPGMWQDPAGLEYVRVRAGDGSLVPLSVFSQYKANTTPLQVNHQGQFPSVTISFNLLPGYALGDAVTAITDIANASGMPSSIFPSFSGTAQEFQKSLANEGWLIAAALATVYIVLGMLYENLIHPITIISTLPSAGVGALLALMACKTDLSVIAFIGIILLIGIVKKNAILMIDLAIVIQRRDGASATDAIFAACQQRFRPIMMTTGSALFGGLPLAFGHGIGSELRQPLGIAIVGGLIFSQVLTLYTTPVIYLYLDRVREVFARRRRSRSASTPGALPSSDPMPS
jgi:multidrug efflux pump